MFVGRYISTLQILKRRDFTFLQQTQIVWTKILQTCSLPDLGREKPPNQIPSLYSPLCYLMTALTAVFLCLGRAMNSGRKDKEPVRVRDSKVARNSIYSSWFRILHSCTAALPRAPKDLWVVFIPCVWGRGTCTHTHTCPVVGPGLSSSLCMLHPCLRSWLFGNHDVRGPVALACQGTDSGPHSTEPHSVQITEQTCLHTASKSMGSSFTFVHLLSLVDIWLWPWYTFSIHWSVVRIKCKLMYCNYHRASHLPS